MLLHLKHTVYILCTFLLFNSCASAPPSIYDEYDPLIWSAMVSLKDRLNSKALAKFQEAFEVLPHDNAKDLFYAAEAALKAGKNDVAKEFIKTAFITHNPDSTYYVSFFAPFKGEEIFDEIAAERAQLREAYYANLPYPKQVLDHIEKMQNSSRKFISAEHKRKTDSINLSLLTAITRKHGWIDKAHFIALSYKLTGGEDNEVWNDLKLTIDDEIKKGKLRKSFWTFLDDVQQIQKNQKQIYGTSQNWDEYPIMNLKKVDKRRAKIGLPPLWYLYKVHGHELPEGYTAANDDFLKSLSEK